MIYNLHVTRTPAYSICKIHQKGLISKCRMNLEELVAYLFSCVEEESGYEHTTTSSFSQMRDQEDKLMEAKARVEALKGRGKDRKDNERKNEEN